MTTARSRPTPAPVRKPQSRTSRRLDTIAGVVLSLLGILEIFAFFELFVIFEAEGIPFSPAVALAVKIVAIVAWFGGTAMFILFRTRGRYGFYWPLIGMVGMIVLAILAGLVFR